MSTAKILRQMLEPQMYVTKAYLEDLSDADLLVRPVPEANHIAWQLGHLLVSDHDMFNDVLPGMMPPLPAGFAERHTSETAKLDDPEAFHSKREYLRLIDEQRAATLAKLDQLSEADLERPTPAKYQGFAASVGAMFGSLTTHWMMHAGQWAVVRRKLGRPPLF